VALRFTKPFGWLLFPTVFILACALVVSGCSAFESEAKENAPEIIVVWSAFDYSHDPLQAKDSEQFFLNSLEKRTLFKLDDKGELKNDLAKSIEISKDGKKITVLLEKQTFSDGATIAAVDVKATLSRIMLVGGEYQKLLETVKGSSEAKSGSDFFGISAPNKSTVEIELITPDPFFAYRLAHPATAILPASSIGLKGEITSNVHSGQYSAEAISNELNATTVFKPRSENYPIINVVRKSPEDFNVAPKQVDVDLILGETKKSSSFTTLSVPQLAAASWNIYVKDGQSPFANIQFRQAVLSALDNEESLKAFASRAIEPDGFTADTFDSVDCIKSCKMDTKESKRLIEKVYPDGKVPDITIHIENNAVQQELAKSAIERLKEIGVNATTVALTPGDLSNEIARGNVQLFRFGWVSAIPIGAEPLVESFKADSSENVSGLTDTELEKEIGQYLNATTFDGKFKASQGIQNRLQDLWLTRPVAHFHKIMTVSNRLEGFKFDFYGRTNISDIKLKSS